MKTKKLTIIITGILLFLSGLKELRAQTVTDIDGNVYKTVTIGTQTWMAENLKTTKYNDGTMIPLVADNYTSGRRGPVELTWRIVSTGAYCWYNNNVTTYKDDYGALYNSIAVMTEKLCPAGWHVPAIDEWATLISYLGASVAGGELKEKDTVDWHSPNTGATNETGFAALPGGYRGEDGIFNLIGYKGVFWSSTPPNKRGPSPGIHKKAVYISYASSQVEFTLGERTGFSVRCICGDIASGINNVNSDVLSLYPNPAKEKLYLKNCSYPDATILIFNLQGKQVLTKKNDSESIDISNLRQGIYIAKIVCPENIVITKFIKE